MCFPRRTPHSSRVFLGRGQTQHLSEASDRATGTARNGAKPPVEGQGGRTAQEGSPGWGAAAPRPHHASWAGTRGHHLSRAYRRHPAANTQLAASSEQEPGFPGDKGKHSAATDGPQGAAGPPARWRHATQASSCAVRV